jgi:CRP-like cAMP-binding protein
MTTAAQDTGVSENDSHKGGTPMTAIQNPLRCSVDELRTLFLFEKLTDEQLNWLCERGHVEEFEPGVVYTEGDDATCFFVLLSGNTVLSRRVGADDVETTRTSQPGVYSGAMRAYLGGNAP